MSPLIATLCNNDLAIQAFLHNLAVSVAPVRLKSIGRHKLNGTLTVFSVTCARCVIISNSCAPTGPHFLPHGTP